MWEGCLHSSRPQESGDKTSKLAKLAKLLLKLVLWLLLLCFFLLRLLFLLRRRDVSQKLSELRLGSWLLAWQVSSLGIRSPRACHQRDGQASVCLGRPE